MDPGPLRDVLTLAVGLATGAMSAAFGVGGAVISTPGVRLLGASAFVAVGTTLPSILPSAASGTARYMREQLIEWRVVAWTAPVGMVGAVVGSLGSHAVPGRGHWLMVLTAVLLALTAYRTARPRPQDDRPARIEAARAGDVEGSPSGGVPAPALRRRTALTAAGVGAAAGVLSGLLGVGGGAVMMPGFLDAVGMPLKRAIATSLVCVGILAVPSTISHAVLGDVDWRFALLLAVAVVPGARLGAAATVVASDRRLRLVVAVCLGTIAVLYGGAELTAALR